MRSSSVSKEKFDSLTKQQGYKNSKEEEEPQMALELVNMNMNEQISEAVKIAIINADNRGSHVLGKEDVDAVKRILRIFPPSGEKQHQVPVLAPPQVPQLDQKTKQKRVRNVGIKTSTKKIVEKKK